MWLIATLSFQDNNTNTMIEIIPALGGVPRLLVVEESRTQRASVLLCASSGLEFAFCDFGLSSERRAGNDPRLCWLIGGICLSSEKINQVSILITCSFSL